MTPLRPYFERYMDAYLACDPGKFGGFFDFPCLIVDSRGDHILSDLHDLEDYERPFLEHLKDKGLSAIEYEELAARQVNESDCFCTNRYRIFGRDRQLIGDMEYHYFLAGTTGDWHIKFARMGQLRHWTT